MQQAITFRCVFSYALVLHMSFFMFCSNAAAQQTGADSQAGTWICVDLTSPEFPGGPKALANYLSRNVQYPDSAAKAKITGKVFISFIIDTTGQLSSPVILRSLGHGCDREAIRIINAMPRWVPGRQSGKAVRVSYNLPILFGSR